MAAVRGDEMLKDEMAGLLDAVAGVEEAVRLRSRRAPERFRGLLVRLNLKALRGELFLHDVNSMEAGS